MVSPGAADQAGSAGCHFVERADNGWLVVGHRGGVTVVKVDPAQFVELVREPVVAAGFSLAEQAEPASTACYERPGESPQSLGVDACDG